jgi:hypothetical protein
MGRTAMPFESVIRKRSRSSEDGDRALSALQTSGQSVASFAEADGVQAQRIHLSLSNPRCVNCLRRSIAPTPFVDTPISPDPDCRLARDALNDPPRRRLARVLHVVVAVHGVDSIPVTAVLDRYVRDRAVPLPEAKSLRELVDDPNRGRAAKISYLDCEISAGRARGGARPWAIERSTLPWREGCALDPPFSVRAGALTMREGWVAVTSTFALEDLALLSDVDGGN